MYTTLYKQFAKAFLIFSFIFFSQLSIVNNAFAIDPNEGSSSSKIPSFETNITADDELTCTLVRIVDTLAGPMGKAIATLAIIALGIGLFMGKLSWGLAVATAMGIAMIFGAPNIVDWLSGGHFHGSYKCRSYGK